MWRKFSCWKLIVCCLVALSLAGLAFILVGSSQVKFCIPRFHLISAHTVRSGTKGVFFQSQWKGWLREGLARVRKPKLPVNKVTFSMMDSNYVCVAIVYRAQLPQAELLTLSAELKDSAGTILDLGRGSYAGDFDGKTHISSWTFRFTNANNLSYCLLIKSQNYKRVVDLNLVKL